MPFDSAPYRPVSPEIADRLEKMDKVIALLDEERKWCKQQLRSYDGRRCILGAMIAVNATITLRQPILDAIHQVTGRDWLRIELFNDHPWTTHEQVLHVLDRARFNIASTVPVAAPAPVKRSLLARLFG